MGCTSQKDQVEQTKSPSKPNHLRSSSNHMSFQNSFNPSSSDGVSDRANIIINISGKIFSNHQTIMSFHPNALHLPQELIKNIQYIEKNIGKHKNKNKILFKHIQKFGPICLSFDQIYKGQWSQGSQCGFGEFFDKKLTYYIGTFFMGSYHGYGRIIYEDGDCYQGYWYMGKPCGNGVFYSRHGKVLSEVKVKSVQEFLENTPNQIENTSVFYGQINQYKKHDYGLQIWENGSYYLGNFNRDMKEGLGEMNFANGDRYFGGFKNNLFSNTGYFKWANQSFYLGKYKDGKKDGQGIFQDDNILFEGHFSHGQRNGKGCITYLKTKERFNSIWQHGKQLNDEEIKKLGFL
ncbi:hypothetical protein pb186bvf_005836 [Paramecium bursaria]